MIASTSTTPAGCGGAIPVTRVGPATDGLISGFPPMLIVTPLTRGDGREVFLVVGHLEGLAAREAASLPPDRRKRLVQELRAVNAELATHVVAEGAPSESTKTPEGQAA